MRGIVVVVARSLVADAKKCKRKSHAVRLSAAPYLTSSIRSSSAQHKHQAQWSHGQRKLHAKPSEARKHSNVAPNAMVSASTVGFMLQSFAEAATSAANPRPSTMQTTALQKHTTYTSTCPNAPNGPGILRAQLLSPEADAELQR